MKNAPDKSTTIQSLLTRQMYSAVNTSLVVGVLLALLFVYLLRDESSSTLLFAWLFLIVIVTVLRFILAVAFQRISLKEPFLTQTWLTKFRVGVVASGVVWGLACLLVDPAHQPQHMVFLIFILAGMMSGVVISYSSDFFSVIAYSLLALLPLTVRLFVTGDTPSVAMGMTSMLYLVFMAMYARHTNRQIIENITLRLDAAEREERYRLLLTHSPVGIFHYDTNLVITYCNNRFASMLQNSMANIVGLDIKLVKDQSILPILWRALEGEVGEYEGQYFATFSNGGGWINMSCAPIHDINGNIASGVAIVQDITERKKLEVELKENELRYRTVADYTFDWEYWIMPDNTFRYVSPSCEQISGYTSDEFYADPQLLMKIIHPDDLPLYVEHRHSLSAAGVPEPIEFRIRTKHGAICWLSHVCRPVYDRSERNLGQRASNRDITDRKDTEAQIHSLAFYDALTELPNRRLLNDRLGQAIAVSQRSGHYGALMFLDLDNFKPLNDKHGHNAGDLLLIEVARRISRCVREVDTVARFGGDEFVVILSELDKDKSKSIAETNIIAEKILSLLAEPYLLKTQQEDETVSVVEHRCTSSIGVVIFINHEATAKDLLKWADMAMYEAKNDGRNTIRFFEPKDSTDIHGADQDAMMLRLNWHESYICGEHTIDQEHRKLFDLANTLIETAFTRNENPEKFDSALEKLLEHATKHFADEEAILAQHHYIDLAGHAQAHKVLIEHALQLRDSAAAGGVSIGELVDFLAEEVVSKHMLKADRKFFPLFNEI